MAPGVMTRRAQTGRAARRRRHARQPSDGGARLAARRGAARRPPRANDLDRSRLDWTVSRDYWISPSAVDLRLSPAQLAMLVRRVERTPQGEPTPEYGVTHDLLKDYLLRLRLARKVC